LSALTTTVLQFYADSNIAALFVKKIQRDATMYQNVIIPHSYEAQHVLGDTPPIIRSLKLYCQPLVFSYMEGWRTCSWWTLLGTLCPTTSTSCMSNNLHVWKTRGCQ